MKLKTKTNNVEKKPANTKINKSPKKQGKGVEVRKEKIKAVVKPTVLKKEAKASTIESPQNPQKILQQELWSKAIVNVSNMSNLSEEVSSIIKLLADYKKKSSIPSKNLKLKNFITKGFSKFKDTSDEVLEEIYNKISIEFKAIGGVVDKTSSENKVSSKKDNSKTVKPKTKKQIKTDEENDDESDDNKEDVDDDEIEDDLMLGSDIDEEDNDIEDEEDDSEDEKPKVVKNNKSKGNKMNNKNGKNQANKGQNGSKFKDGKVQKKKKFGKKK